VKLSGRQIEAFVRRPEPGIRAVLVYGPDAGLVSERIAALVNSVPGAAADPFRFAELSAAALKDGAALNDEAAALALTGGRRVIVVRGATDGVADRFAPLVDGDVPGDSLVLAEAGDLPPSSTLRKLFEKGEAGAALPCYADSEEDRAGLIRSLVEEAGQRIEPMALDYLASALPADRLVMRREVEKLLLYKGGEKGSITAEEVEAVVGDAAAVSLEDVAFAATGGNPPALDLALQRALADGNDPVQILGAVRRHLHRVQLASAAYQGGASPQAAMERLRPPVFFRRKPEFQAQLQRWSPGQIDQALELLTEAEFDCKTTGLPGEAVCGRALLRIANAGRRAPATRRN
jgi:DNA polymerase-3 subunit delta